MPIRLVKKPVLVVRDGAQVQPPVGREFNFTDAEVKEINALNPSAIDYILTVDAETPVTEKVVKK